MRIVLCSDHAGYPLKVPMGEVLHSLGLDVGAYDEKPSGRPGRAGR